MYAPAYAGAAVAEAKAKAKASMAKYLASLVKREEEGWTVLAAEVPQAPDERFFSSADELEQTPLIPAKRKAEDEPRTRRRRTWGEKELPMPRFPPAAARLEEARLDTREDAKWQRRRELMAKVKEQASSEEDEAPRGGSVLTKALKVSEGLYQFSDDQMVGDFPCFDAPTAGQERPAAPARL